MHRFWQYVFCLLLIGSTGLFVGYCSRSGEVSVLREWVSYIPAVIEKPVLVFKFVPIPFMKKNTDQELAVARQEVKNSAELAPLFNDHMKQIAHVPVANDTLSDVSKPLNALDAEFKAKDLVSQKEHAAYIKQIEQVCTLLKSVNHEQRPIRMLARLELAQVLMAGPLSRHIQNLVTSLLVRYCDDSGKLVQCDYDPAVEDDIHKAIELLQAQLEHRDSFEPFAQVDFVPIQRRVQRHAYNEALKSVLTANCIPYTAG